MDAHDGLPRDAYIPQEWDESWNRPVVYLIWKRLIGKSDELQLIVICSSEGMAKRRLSGLNNWAKGETQPWRFSMERVPIDHLFGSVELGMCSIEEDALQDMIRTTVARAKHHEAVLENVKTKARERIQELEARIEVLSNIIQERLGAVEEAVAPLEKIVLDAKTKVEEIHADTFCRAGDTKLQH